MNYIKCLWLLALLIGVEPAIVFASAKSKRSDQNGMNLIYDGRNEANILKLTDTEKDFVEKEVRKSEKEIKNIGEKNDFQCEEDSFRVINSVRGSFTKPKLRQKAALYQFCLQGKAQYAGYLGGIIIIENNTVIAHYVFSNISGFDVIKSLPDINRNGLSEIALEFNHSINSLNFAKAIGIYEIGTEKMFNLGTIDTFSRLSTDDNDIAYKVFVKISKKTVFYREKYESEEQKNIWRLAEKLKEFSVEKSDSANFVRLPIE